MLYAFVKVLSSKRQQCLLCRLFPCQGTLAKWQNNRWWIGQPILSKIPSNIKLRREPTSSWSLFIHGSLSTHASGSLAQEFVSGGFNYLISEAGKVGLVSSHASNVPFNYGWTCFHFLIHTDVTVRVSWWTFGHVKPIFGTIWWP